MMLFEDERRTRISRSEAERISNTVEKLKQFADVAVDLQQMDQRSYASIELYGAGFSTWIKEPVVQVIRAGQCSMMTIINQPEIREMLDLELSYRPDHTHLVRRIVPSVAADLMRLSRAELDALETLQMEESSIRYENSSLEGLYHTRGGRPDFRGGLSWGLIDHNATNFYFDNETGAMVYLVRFATTLPHVRYECMFKGFLDGSMAEIRQQLVVNPRVAFIHTGFVRWYSNLEAK